MAGAGYRTWTAGEVVTASNVQNFLQDQTIGVYAGTAARSSAVLSPSEGQVSYRTDDDVVEVYNGTAWVPVAPADTAGLVHIKQATGSGVAAINVNDCFSADFTHYKVVTDLLHATSSAGSGVNIRLRVSGADDTTTNYRQQRLSISSTTVTAERTSSNTSWIDSSVIFNNQKNLNFFEIANPFQSSITTCYNFRGQDGLATIQYSNLYYSFIATTSFTGFSVISASGNMSGSVDVYGYKLGS
jgi:hypothetical protein